MRPHIEQMEKNIAEALHIETNQVNVKATTEKVLDLPEVGKEFLPRQSVQSKS